MADFKLCIPSLLENEGGFVNNSNDRGGPTNFGITQNTLSLWRGKSVSVDDVKNMTALEAETIYLAKYWKRLNLDGVNDQDLAAVVFDSAVNRGPAKTAIDIQKILGVNEDGAIGAGTIAAINKMNAKTLLKEFIKSTQLAYATIVADNPDQSQFIRGWITRTHKYMDLLC